MLQYKTPKADLRRSYNRVFKISLIIVISMLIAAFRFFPDVEQEALEMEGPQELITVEDIMNTKHENRPPPPPKPPVPIEAPSDDLLDDVEIGTMEIDMSEEVAAPPPPPKEEKKIIVEEEPQFFVAVEQQPEPIGGLAALQEKVVYPEIAQRAGVEGKVYVMAYVNEEGIVEKAEVMKGIGAGCDEEAVKAVLETRFTPGKQRGRPVRVKMGLPIVFIIK